MTIAPAAANDGRARHPRRRNKIAGQFSAKLIEMLESPAWRVLSLSARRVIERVEVELAHHGGNDNDALPVTYENFLAYGIGNRDSIAAARREAVALGFLRYKPGRGGNREFRQPDLFGITFDVRAPTHEWRKIATSEEAWAIAGAARKAKDPQAVAFGRARAKQRAEKNQSGKTVFRSRKNTVFGPGKQDRNDQSPGPGNRDYSPSPETGTTSISGDGVRSAPPQGAVASTPSKTVQNDPASRPPRTPEEQEKVHAQVERARREFGIPQRSNGSRRS
jgi:hypothetical protein